MANYRPERRKIFDGEYFKIAGRLRENCLLVQCMTCPRESKPLRTSVDSNGNLLKHVARMHPNMLSKIRKEKLQRELKKRHSYKKVNTSKPIKFRTLTPQRHKSIEQVIIKSNKNNNDNDDDDKDTIISETQPTLPVPRQKQKIEKSKDQGEYYAEFSKSHENYKNRTKEVDKTKSDINKSSIDNKKNDQFLADLDEFNYPISMTNTAMRSAIEMTKKKNGLLREMKQVEEKHSIEMETLMYQLEYIKNEHRTKLQYLNNKLNEMF